MKKKYLIISLLGATAVTSLVGGIAISNLNNNSIKEKVADDLFVESTDACDDIFGNGLSSFAGGKVTYNKGLDANEENALYSPKLGVQVSDVVDHKISIRYTAAISSTNIDAVWTRTVYDKSGNVVRGTKNVAVSTAYVALSTSKGLEYATDIAVGDEHPYNYYVIYTLRNIPVDDGDNALYKVDCNLTISQGDEKVATPTGSVEADESASISTYEATVEIGTNYTYHGSNSSAGNGQYINGKLKTIYSESDTTLNTNYMSLNITKTYSNKTEKSTLYYNSFNTAGVNTSGFSAGELGKQTISVNNGAASYDIYVLANNIAYKDSKGNYVVTVDKNYIGTIGAVSGTNGNMFTTIGQALEFLQNPTFVTQSDNKILNICAGYYNEKLEITTPNLTINGAKGTAHGTYSADENYNSSKFAESTIIEFDSLYGEEAGEIPHTTDSTQTVAIRDSAVNCKINGVTISNAWNCVEYFVAKKGSNSVEHRALALLCQADQFVMTNSSLLGYQDTVEFFEGRQYLNNCFISGTTDYIFGTNNITLFEDCVIHTIDNGSVDGGYVTAFKGENKGNDSPEDAVVFYNCNFTGDSDVSNTSLARPWAASSNVAFINCDMSSAISTAAFTAESTKNQRYVCMSVNKVLIPPTSATYVEYGNTGAGAISTQQAGMTLLDADGAAKYFDSNNNFNYSLMYGKTNGDVSFALSWNPYTGVEQDNNTYYWFHSTAPTTGTVYEFDSSDCNKTGNYVVGDLTFTNCQRRTAGNDDLYVGGSISFSVAAGTTVTVNSYPGYHAYKIGDRYANSDTVTFYFATAQEVVIEKSSSAAFYLYSIVINSTNQSDTAEYSGVGLSPDSIEIFEGESIDLSKVKVYEIYSTGYIVYLDNTQYTRTGSVDTNTPGNYSYVYSYNNKTNTLDVIVKENNVESISVVDYITTYSVGSSFDDTMTVNATYSNNSIVTLDSSDYSVDYSDVDFNTTGSYNVEVTYLGNTNITTTFSVTVSAGEYTITFMDGETVKSSCTGSAGDAIEYPSDTSKSGYQFVRYYLDSDYTKPFDSNTIPNQNITVYMRYMEVNKSGITYVSTAEELVTAINNQSRIWLTADIDMTGSTYIGIGNAWAGNFNGYGYTISNWTPTYDANQRGFFGNAYQGTIEDVIFKDCVVSDGGVARQYLGLLTAATYDDEIIKNVKLVNCSMNTSSSNSVGLIGTVPQAHGSNPSLAIINLTIENCSVSGTQYVGGVFGYVQNSTVISITNSNVDVKCTTNGVKIIGGIAGQIQGSAQINVNNSNIKLKITNGDTYIGGVVGYSDAGSVIVSNTNIELDVTAQYNIGGVIGETKSGVTITLSNDLVTGTITALNGASGYENTYVGHGDSGTDFSTCKYKDFTLSGASSVLQGTLIS